jgi:hypothetical protein
MIWGSFSTEVTSIASAHDTKCTQHCGVTLLLLRQSVHVAAMLRAQGAQLVPAAVAGEFSQCYYLVLKCGCPPEVTDMLNAPD